MLLDLGSHLVDQALQHFGPVASVYAEIANRRGLPGDDDDFLALTHRSGVISHLHASALAAAPGPRLRVLGSEAALIVRELDSQEDRLRAGERPDTVSDWGVEPEHARPRLIAGERSVPLTPERGAWQTFYALFERALSGERTGAGRPARRGRRAAGAGSGACQCRRAAPGHAGVGRRPAGRAAVPQAKRASEVAPQAASSIGILMPVSRATSIARS